MKKKRMSRRKTRLSGLNLRSLFGLNPHKGELSLNPHAGVLLMLALLWAGCDTVGPERTYVITGEVRSEVGNVPGVYVTIGGGVSQTVITDADGSFRFDGLPGGLDYVLAASLDDWLFQPPLVQISNLRFDRHILINGTRESEIVGGINLTELFRPATDAEKAQIEAEWSSRTVETSDYRVEYEADVPGASLRIVSHIVDGLRHVALVRIPTEGSPLPVIVLNHGGDTGIDADEYLAYSDQFGDLLDRAIIVMPAFRSESIRIDGRTFVAEGEPSTWDRDVDDAIGAMQAVMANEPRARLDRPGTIGFSRGGGVSLLMAARESSLAAAVSFFGPTDFFDDYVRHVTRTVLTTGQFFVPGSRNLHDVVLRPLQTGAMSPADARLEMVRRSSALFANRMPAVQIHHGTQDPVVWASQAHRFDEAMNQAGRSAPSDTYEFHLYEGAGHNPAELQGSFTRTSEFLLRHLE
jgi:pimeloyl-ACP methyl ester carboxylesterase